MTERTSSPLFLCGAHHQVIPEEEVAAMAELLAEARANLAPDERIPIPSDDSPFWRRIYRRHKGKVAEIAARNAMEAEALDRREQFGLIRPEAPDA
ncbi:MAG: hypothetical protein AB7G23_19315 [Vicinamibacterales bacterium]